MKDKKKVSIVVPVYNAENYIEKCLDSILNQSYKNIEILAINDGSKDNSLKILKKIAKENKCIKVIDQENCGVAKTRNKAIKEATGKYIMFVDNDDYIDKEYIETFVDEIDKNDYDFVIGGYRRVDYSGNCLYERVYKETEWTLFNFITPWGRIYNRKFLIDNSIEFLPVKVGEDINFSILAAIYKNKAKVIKYVGYNQLYNEQSVSNTVHKKNDSNNKNDLINLYNNIYLKCNNKLSDNNAKLLKYFFLKTTVWYLLYSCKKSDINNLVDTYHEIIDEIKKYYPLVYKHVSIFKPKGETIKVRFVVKMIVLFDRIKLLKLFLRLYAKI